MATTTAAPWQRTILYELGELQLNDRIPADHTHAAVLIPEDGDARLLGTANGELAAIVIAEDKAAGHDGEAQVVKLADLVAWSRDHATASNGVEAHDEPDADADRTPEPDAEGNQAAAGEAGALFDASDFDREDLQIPKVDGQTIDRISLKFTGEVFLDRSEPSDVAVYNAFRLGKDVSLLIEAKCSSTAAKGATDREGDLDVVVGTKGLKVHSIQKPAGADWVENA